MAKVSSPSTFKTGGIYNYPKIIQIFNPFASLCTICGAQDIMCCTQACIFE